MKFHDYPDAYHNSKTKMPLDEWHAAAMEAVKHDDEWVRKVAGEFLWHRKRRPYYNVWPKIVPMLTRIDLSAVQATAIEPPLSVMAIRFADPFGGPAFTSGDGRECAVRTIMLTDQPANLVRHWRRAEKEEVGGIAMWYDVEERSSQRRVPMFAFNVFARKPGDTVADALGNIPETQSVDMKGCSAQLMGLTDPSSFVTLTKAVTETVVRLVCTICLIGNDPELITPDVLSADRDKFEATQDQILLDKLIDKARRRGKYGFDIGRGVEIAPHYRRPHPFLAWTGPGRKIPRIVLRKGSVIHREVIEKVPTGIMPEGE